MFLSTVSHDLRTPLNAILGFAEMLETGVYGPMSDRQQGAVERIVANASRQLSLVNDLLDQARIEAGQLSLQMTSFAPADLIEEAISGISALAQAKGLELTSQVADGVPAMLAGDRQRLHQVLTNLIGNGIKFTEQGGIHVHASRPDEDHWALQVTDTGPGISKEDQDYVFEPFRQVDGSITRQHKGVGLGLSIVKQLVTLMDGEVELDSEVGRGSTFTVVLPLVIPTKEEIS
jgi:signal transduction histidine kinase